MILIVGLGNPGKEYEETRHNIGFMAVNSLSKKLGADSFSLDKKRNAEVASGIATFNTRAGRTRFVLVKPQTFMNESGRAVRGLVDFYRIRPEDQLWVIHDDLDIELGSVRIRVSGSSAGQKGVESIIKSLGTDKFVRFRVGIKPENNNSMKERLPAEEFVLKPFSNFELPIVKSQIDKLDDIIYESLDRGIVETSL